MESKVIEWNGTETPEELFGLPPGRYVIEALDSEIELTDQEDEGIAAALNDLDSGRGSPLEDVMKRLHAVANRQ